MHSMLSGRTLARTSSAWSSSSRPSGHAAAPQLRPCPSRASSQLAATASGCAPGDGAAGASTSSSRPASPPPRELATSRRGVALALAAGALALGQGQGAAVADEEVKLPKGRELKTAKGRYRLDYDSLKAAREDLEPQLAGVAVARAVLLEAFDRWAGAQSEATLKRMATAGRALPAAAGDEEDELDAGEAFERMHLARITERDPDSLAYHAALKRTTGPAANGGGGGGGEYRQLVKRLSDGLRESIEAEASGAAESEVRRKADPAKEAVREFVGRWRDNPRVTRDLTHVQIKAIAPLSIALAPLQPGGRSPWASRA
ncbi:Kinesin-like protein KLP1 [Tetrabaena socialis]|uniref:Kinesin-like protein KLP1 n=1 Tax=Tetrabaena socialis TaxID=47790 RepID=A0A2J8AAA9_9CHLO|nr:Kinesin-like protein KLP1 [Tetrabaena socialis]|eukprot:PNH09459.1 Kinesin-like protein KLP1 [Tetrabaena socialis]